MTLIPYFWNLVLFHWCHKKMNTKDNEFYDNVFKNLMKFKFDAGSSVFIIVLMILIFLMVVLMVLRIVTPMYCCGCTKYKLCNKSKEDKFKREILEMDKQRNSLDVETVERGELLAIGPISEHKTNVICPHFVISVIIIIIAFLKVLLVIHRSIHRNISLVENN